MPSHREGDTDPPRRSGSSPLSVDLAGDHMTAPWVEGAVRSGQLAAARLGALLD